jgi:uncharacterized delta-60 repeat protein
MLSGMVSTVAVSKTSAAENVHPALAQLAAESPEQEVRVIVQQAGPSAEGRRATEQLGGTVLKELSLINAFVAELPAKSISKLSYLEAVRWISLDARMVSSSVAPGFDTDGIVTTPIGNDSDQANAVVLQPDGKIVTAGSTNDGGNYEIAVVRYNADGSLDLSFDTDGKVVTSVGRDDDLGYAVALQPDGKIIVAGASKSSKKGNYDIALTRYNTDGALDTTFDGDGKLTADIARGDDYGRAVAIQSDGKIVVAGHYNDGTYDKIVVLRFNSDGSFDNSFDGDGKVTTAIGPNNDYGFAMVLQPDSKIVVAGYSKVGNTYDFAVVRYNSNGSLDTAFDGDGMVTTAVNFSNDYGYAVALQPDGKIIVAGSAVGGGLYNDFAAARYNPNGSLDTTFDGDGKVITSLAYNYDSGRAIAIQPDGKIVVAGDAGSSLFALVRYNANGDLDASFDGDGMVTTPVGSSLGGGKAVVIQPDGKIVVAGSGSDSTTADFAVVRYNGDGGLDCAGCIDTSNIEANLYPSTLGVDQLHAEGITGQGVTVAVIDSGIADHTDFAGRLISIEEYPTGDLYGHGTHVTGIIGGDGSASGGVYTGVAPEARFIALGVSDETGMAYESDVVDAMQWVFDNKELYNIRVVNMSLNSTVEDSYHNSGIDAAVEILWFNDVVVVASAGNKGPAGGYNTARSAPANDPFLIAVGASNEHETADRVDDTIAPYSAFGTTQDGFFKPDLIAPGHDIYSALSPDSTWDDDYPDRVGYAGQYFRISGTSMAAPMVSGAVALLLQDEPGLTPNQVKYRLLNSGSTLVNDEGDAFPYVDVYAVVHGKTTEEANQGIVPHMLLAKMAMIAYWASQNGEENIDWENVDWGSVNWNAVNWNAVNWNAVNWNAVNWNAVNWNAVNWNAVNWNAVNWNAVNWNAVYWGED